VRGDGLTNNPIILEQRMLRELENLAKTDPLADPVQRATIDRILAENRHLPGATMVVLNELQNQIGFISTPMQAYVAQKLRVPQSEVNGVVSFYSFFTTTPRGKHTVKFCLGTACYVGGSPRLIDKAREELGIGPDETTPDGAITVEVCRCIGACSQAPAVVVDKTVHGRVHPNQLPQILDRCRG
jgi:NADH:ubiquinone oxidoreductase subunit E